MRFTTLLFGALALAAGTMTAPASAVEAELGGTGDITVYGDLGACAYVSFPGQVIVGQFVAVAAVQGPGTRYGTTRGASPVTGYGYWSACVSGTYAGATAGDGKYELTASSTAGDVVVVKQCVVNRGTVSCV